VRRHRQQLSRVALDQSQAVTEVTWEEFAFLIGQPHNAASSLSSTTRGGEAGSGWITTVTIFADFDAVLHGTT
jgi:hypothetical protein